ncbi:BnaA07g09740D [Brassica napus]|uniref:(rape) hypothetical protein n=1 Tax=Brassica napus TaxID=3708 RepID=A0A078GMH1_BRANA|nr:unnamed protein product [Brassica napus]CDY25808.1 BnaA07g09740D [Brassica napus]
MMTTEDNVPDDYARVRDDYWRVVRESGGFDLKNVSIPSYMCGTPICAMRTFEGHDGCYPYRDLVKGYCIVRLQRYNMKHGINYKMSSLIKFNMTTNSVSSYYLTLLARDPDVSPSDKTFQVNRSEWKATGWIFMYLVLVIYSHDKFIVTRDKDYQSKLKIVNMAIETSADDSEPSKERLKGKSAHVYITFKGLDEPQAPRQSSEFGEHVERRDIVRRVIFEST